MYRYLTGNIRHLVFFIFIGVHQHLSSDATDHGWLHSQRHVIYDVIRRGSFQSNTIVLLFDNNTDMLVTDIWETVGDENSTKYLPIMVDALIGTSFRDYIKQLIEESADRYLHFIAILEEENIFTVIRHINYIDENSKKSTNIRHWSKWIIFHHLHQYKKLENLVHQFDNMALVYLRERDGHYACHGDVMTLVMSQHGAVFTPVDISRDVFQVFPNINYGYNGRQLKIITKTWASFIEERDVNGSLHYEGYVVDILNTIALKLNFTYKLYNDRVSAWNYYREEENGMFNKIITGQYDIFCAPTIVTEKRLQYMDFIFPAYITDTLIATYKKKHHSAMFLYAQPFQSIVLIIIAACSVCFCCIFWSIENVNPNNIGRETASFKEKVFHVTGIILNQGGIGKIDSLSVSGRLCLVSFWFFCIIIGSVYKGNLVAFFTYTGTDEFQSLDDILDSNYGIGGVFSNVTITNWQTLPVPTYRRLSERFLRDDHETKIMDNDFHLNKVLAGNYVYLSESVSSEFIYANNCDIVRYQKSIQDFLFAFAIPKDSPMKHELEAIMNALQSNGFLDQRRKVWWRGRQPGFCNKQLHVKQLHLSDIYSIFIFITACLLLCSIVICIEMVRFKIGLRPV